jgi:hypothetical protein
MRITDLKDQKTGNFGSIKRADNKYVLWSTMVDAPICKITRAEIANEIQFRPNAQLLLASLDGIEAIASLQLTRDTGIESAIMIRHEMTLENVVKMYDQLETWEEWKKTNESN